MFSCLSDIFVRLDLVVEIDTSGAYGLQASCYNTQEMWWVVFYVVVPVIQAFRNGEQFNTAETARQHLTSQRPLSTTQ